MKKQTEFDIQEGDVFFACNHNAQGHVAVKRVEFAGIEKVSQSSGDTREAPHMLRDQEGGFRVWVRSVQDVFACHPIVASPETAWKSLQVGVRSIVVANALGSAFEELKALYECLKTVFAHSEDVTTDEEDLSERYESLKRAYDELNGDYLVLKERLEALEAKGGR